MPRSSNLDNVAPDESLLPPTANNPTTRDYRQEIDKILATAKGRFFDFVSYPQKFNFQERNDSEDILIVLRQHWFTNVSWIFIAILMSIAPITLKYVPLLSFFPANYQRIAVIFWYLITIIFTYEKFLSWYFDVYVITTERVIDIDFDNLLNKKFSEAKISVIQDVSSQVTGLSQTMFNYGTILIQTAAEINQIIFKKIPNPDIVIKVLEELRQKEEQEMVEGRIK